MVADGLMYMRILEMENCILLFQIDDDFLDDENLPFDDAAFTVIDSGEEYLNPNHFSVGKLLRQYVRSDNV